MPQKRLIVPVCCALALCMASLAGAQLSEKYAGWADGPEGFLLTKQEKKEWDGITTDAEAERFIDLFWARRNPDPTNPFNTFKAEFESKVGFADENFGYGNRRGALTDRGRVLILMGRPDGRDLRGSSQAPSVEASASGTVEGRTDIWVYEVDKLPKAFKAKGDTLVFLFYEEKLDSNIFVLDRSNRESFKAVSALSHAPEAYLLHPELKEVPKPVSIANASSATAQHLAWLDVKDAPYNDVVKVISELGVKDDVTRPLWLHLELPPDAPKLDLLVGRVKGDDGEVISNFEIAAEPLEGQYGTAYHLSFPLDAGFYTIDIAGGAAGTPQVTRSLEVEVTTIPDEGVWMSPIWLGVDATANRQAALGDPFSFGGWHLMPISGPELTRASQIAYFGFLVRPELNEEGKVALRARMRLKKDGKPLGQPLTMPLETSHVLGDLYMYGNSIGLSGLPETGSYEIEFEVTETTSDTTVERILTIDVTE
jgi:GWxTD domain-containing protein